jgi:hypothetical protein
MEIKIVRTTRENEDVGFQTIIIEGFNIHYEFIEYENRADFIMKYNNATRSRAEGGKIIGVPITFWNETEKDIEPGEFVYLFYSIDERIFNGWMICKNCTIYITNKGNTIDKIRIDTI